MPKNPAHFRASTSSHPAVESLEPRRLLSVSMGQHSIDVEGTRRNDVISIRQDTLHASKLVITVNGVAAKYSMDAITQLTINAGRGNDVISVDDIRRSFSVNISAGDGDDQVTTARLGATGEFNVGGEGGNDKLTAGPAYNNSFDGGAGNDTLTGGASNNNFSGGDGNDILSGPNAAYDGFNGGEGNDTLTGGHFGDALSGNGGNDLINAGAGNDSLDGNDGNDLLNGDAGDDSINGEEGNDVIEGGDGNDLVDAGEGDDVLHGGAGNDQLCGDDGNDTINGQDGNDFLLGDEDNHFPLLDPNNQPISDGHIPGNDSLDGGAGNDTLLGSHQSDTYAYDNGIDTLTGGSGNDVIDARGNDIVADLGSSDLVPYHYEQNAPGASPVIRTAHISIKKVGNFGQFSTAAIPAGVGQFGPNPRLYTTDASGTLHLGDTGGTPFTLGEFFRNWGYHTDGHSIAGIYDYTLMVNNQPSTAGPELVIHDGDVIVMTYGRPSFG